jgi:hypothetical protein
MEPKEIVKYRKQTKKVFVAADIPDWSFTIGAGVDAVKPMIYFPYLTNQGVYSFCTNMKGDRRQFAAFRILADIRWKRFSFTPVFDYGSRGDSLHLMGSLDTLFWVVPETVALGLQFLYMKDQSTGTAYFSVGGSKDVMVTTEYLYLDISSRFKASQRVGFGVNVGIPAPLFGRAVINELRVPTANSGFPCFVIFADFWITRSLAVRLNIDALSYSYLYELDKAPNSEMAFLAGLMLSWKFDVKEKKP